MGPRTVPKRTKGPCVGYGCPDFHAAGNSEDGAQNVDDVLFRMVVVRGFVDVVFSGRVCGVL